jgi:hypothetical protein
MKDTSLSKYANDFNGGVLKRYPHALPEKAEMLKMTIKRYAEGHVIA